MRYTILQVLEEARAHLEEERRVLEGQLNLVQLEATALQEKCAALEVSSALPNISLEPLIMDTLNKEHVSMKTLIFWCIYFSVDAAGRGEVLQVSVGTERLSRGSH